MATWLLPVLGGRPNIAVTVNESALLMLLLLLAFLAPGVWAAERITFDFHWRFFLGTPSAGPAASCGASNFTRADQQMCSGLSAVDSALTPEACVAACCGTSPLRTSDAPCSVWQFTENLNNSRAHCWVGQCKGKVRSNREGWQGGTRPAPPPPPPGPPPPVTSGPAAVHYDDSAWPMVNAPHDYLIGLEYSPKNAFKNGFLPRSDGFYRKHFQLPASWREAAASGRSDTFRLRFDGVYKVATVWINGVYVETYGDSSAAYTSFVVPLDAVHGLRDGSNVIAMHIDGSYGTEHWYSGAGIYRHAWLERAPSVHMVDNGVFAPAVMRGDAGSVRASVELANAAAQASGPVVVTASLHDAAGLQVGSTSRAEHTGLSARSGAVKVSGALSFHPGRRQCWLRFACVTPALATKLRAGTPAGAAQRAQRLAATSVVSADAVPLHAEADRPD
jgi:hypothetical protein